MNLTVSLSPHARAKDTTRGIMRDVLIALAPAAAFGVYRFGPWAAALIAISVLACIFFEALSQRLLRRAITVSDLSAAVTGLLLALNLPAAAPWWMPVVGAAFAIVIVKQLFGGIGCNFVNPALAARAVLLASWPVHMTDFSVGADAVTGATPLAQSALGAGGVDYLSLFLGEIGGCIGEVSKALLLAGAIYLAVRRVITLWTPLSLLASLAACSLVVGNLVPGLRDTHLADPLYQLLSGGAVLGAFFMATDYATTPLTRRGRVLFGALAGLILYVIRAYGAFPEGTSYAILLMNVATPLIDRLVRPRVFGEVKARA